MAGSNPLISFAKTLAVIPPVGALAAVGLFFYVKGNDQVLSPDTLASSANHDPATLDLTLGQAAGGVMSWVLWSAATAWALAALFVMMAALTRAPTAAKERGMRWVWLALLIATLAALSWMAVAYFGPNALGFDLNSGFYVPVAVAAVVVLTALYWLTTLFATPDTMGPSVPFHELMPRLSGRRLP